MAFALKGHKRGTCSTSKRVSRIASTLLTRIYNVIKSFRPLGAAHRRSTDCLPRYRTDKGICIEGHPQSWWLIRATLIAVRVNILNSNINIVRRVVGVSYKLSNMTQQMRKTKRFSWKRRQHEYHSYRGYSSRLSLVSYR